MKKSRAMLATCFTAMLFALLNAGCTTKTGYISDSGMLESGEAAQAVAGFSEKDIQICVRKALDSLLNNHSNRIVLLPGGNRAVVVMKSSIDTTARGRDIIPLREALEMEFAQQLTDSGKVIVYDPDAAQYATVDVAVQYYFDIVLRERNLRQDDGDLQREYNLNLKLIDAKTGVVYWQRRVPLRKLIDKNNIMN